MNIIIVRVPVLKVPKTSHTAMCVVSVWRWKGCAISPIYDVSLIHFTYYVDLRDFVTHTQEKIQFSQEVNSLYNSELSLLSYSCS